MTTNFAQWEADHPLIPPAHLAAVRSVVPSQIPLGVFAEDEMRALETTLTARLEETAVQKMAFTLAARVRALCTAGRSSKDLANYREAIERAIEGLPPWKFPRWGEGYDPTHIAAGITRQALEEELRACVRAEALHRAAGEPVEETD